MRLSGRTLGVRSSKGRFWFDCDPDKMEQGAITAALVAALTRY
jgi:hypothetical protein